MPPPRLSRSSELVAGLQLEHNSVHLEDPCLVSTAPVMLSCGAGSETPHRLFLLKENTRTPEIQCFRHLRPSVQHNGLTFGNTSPTQSFSEWFQFRDSHRLTGRYP
jgi:hypothetical protein